MLNIFNKLIVSVVIILLCATLPAVKTYGQNAVISSTFEDTMLCVNATFTVPIAITGTFDNNNNYLVQISNSSGNFSTNTVIGMAFGAGTPLLNIICMLPPSVTPGTGYRIRVVTSNPAVTSAPNAKDIRISAFPNVTINPVTAICVGESLTISASSTSPNPTISWQLPGGGIIPSGASYTKSITTLSDSGKYYAIVTSYKCSSKDSVRAIITPAPKINALPSNSPVCEEDALQIDVDCPVCSGVPGMPLPRWRLPDNTITFGGSFKSLKTSLKDSGVYKIIVNIGNCWDSATTYVAIKPLPAIPIASNNGPLCVGATLNLNVTNNTAGVNYTWSGPAGFSGNVVNPTIPLITKNNEGDYLVYATQNGCKSKTGKTTLDVGIPLTEVPVNGDTLLCPGERLQLTAQTNVTSGITWKKLPNGTGILSQNRTFGKSAVSSDDSGLYVFEQEYMGCKSPPTYIHLVIPDLKKPDPKNNGPLCLGDDLELTSSTTANGSYSWTGPSGFASNAQNPARNSITADMGGKYIVTTTLAFCTTTDSTELVTKPNPTITSISNNGPVCTGTYLSLFAESSLTNSTFQWIGPNGFTSQTQNPAITYTDSDSGAYSVKVTKDGCVSEPATTVVMGKIGPGMATAKSNSPLKEGERLELYADNEKDSVTYIWEGPDGFTSTDANPVIPIATYRNAGMYTLMTIYNDCTTSTNTVVDIKDILGITLALYPNPNNGLFTIEGITQTDANLSIIIHNHQGMIVYNGEAQPEKSIFKKSIDMQGAASGVYILRVSAGAEKRTFRFTIVRQ